MFIISAFAVILASVGAAQAAALAATLPVGTQCFGYPGGYSTTPCASGSECCLVTSRTDTGFCTLLPASGICPPKQLTFNEACLDSSGKPLSTPCEANLTCCVTRPDLGLPSYATCTLKQYCV